MKKLEKTYEQLISLDFSNLLDDEAIESLGSLIDISDIIKKTEGLDRALDISELLLKRDLSSKNNALIHYYIANLWSSKRKLSYVQDDETWKWQQQEFEEEILHLRFALLYFSQSANQIDEQIKIRACQIFTNLGNLFDTVGRFVEAIDYYNKALELDPNFSMALGNKGITLFHYGNALYSCYGKILFIRKSCDYLQKAIQLETDRSAKKAFQDYYFEGESWIKQINCKKKNEKNPDNLLGNSEEERQYRSWCLKQKLFLNPLNDILTTPDVERDDILLPLISKKPTAYFDYFNQLKQEYVFSRFVFYQSMNMNSSHYSDRCIPLTDTLNYSIFSSEIEGLKTSFRISYSIFDKIGYFIYKYLGLKLDTNHVYFHSLWYEKGNMKDRILQPNFINKNNWPLRGLFWLSKDLLFRDDDETKPIEPEAKDLKNIRNHLEHKYCIIHEDFHNITEKNDEYYSLSRNELEQKTLKMMKTARAAIINLALGIHREESFNKKDSWDIYAPMFLPIVEKE